MNILFLTNTLPFRRRNGGEVCSHRLLEQLCNMAERVLVVGRGDSMGTQQMPEVEVRSLAQPAVEFSKMSAAQKLVSLTGAITSSEAWTTHRMSSGVLQQLHQALADEAFDCVFIDHLQIYKWYRELGLTSPVVLVAHNIESQVYGDLLQRSRNIVARWILKRERHLLNRLDEAVLRNIGTIACLTEMDKAYYSELARQIGVDATIEVLPGYFSGTMDVKPLPQETESHSSGVRRIGILGTWTWESNRLGLEWFLQEVLPHIDSECEIVIAGQGLQADRLPKRVSYLGFVESPSQFYRSLDVIAIPSIAGGGVQEKTIEAIGYGIPVVATEVAVRGIRPCPANVWVVSTPREFGTACRQRQEYDLAQMQAETHAWNAERRLQYSNAINKLLAAAFHRAGIPQVREQNHLRIT